MFATTSTSFNFHPQTWKNQIYLESIFKVIIQTHKIIVGVNALDDQIKACFANDPPPLWCMGFLLPTPFFMPKKGGAPYVYQPTCTFALWQIPNEVFS